MAEFCMDCPDREACASGVSCEMVHNANLNIDDRLNIQGRNSFVSDAITEEKRVYAENPEDEAMVAALSDWWINRAEGEIRLVAPKAVEYSAIDLIEYGRTLALVMGLNHAVSDEEATEIGIWGYLVGKVARWTGAIKEGRRVSEDTIFDINIYAKMALRNRDVGGWPFGPGEDKA